ncbi:ThiF family adenylyltransferase [Burkholderia sp. LMG 21824]|uniref:ThiF family adenylyltransferase n=1 Tax=Burkholderia sp. LMG 21824 TaxID=3158172 RepID=UPI003C2D91C5
MNSAIFGDFLEKARSSVREISAEYAQELLATYVPFFDVREESEVDQGIIPGAQACGRSFLEMRVTEQVPDLGLPVVVYCASGVRSVVAGASLRALGYTNVMSLAGGLAAWKAEGLPVVKGASLSSGERNRYGRQIILPQVGIDGQAKLKRARILVIGAGGLGAPCLQYLAAAGVGTIGIVDHDSVDLSNLQRQVIYGVQDIGKPKVSAARDRLLAMNSDVRVSTFSDKFDAANALSICRDFDILIDCTDNFTARYLVNDTAIALNLPVIHGAVFQFEGQVALLNHGHGPCYRCIYPESPPSEIAPTCSEAGVIGVVPGVIGTLQAATAIKLVLDLDVEPGFSLIYHALDDAFSKRKLRARANCTCRSGNESIIPKV